MFYSFLVKGLGFVFQKCAWQS